MVWEASNEINLFPVKIREYRKPKDDIHKHLIEFFETYPQQLSTFQRVLSPVDLIYTSVTMRTCRI